MNAQFIFVKQKTNDIVCVHKMTERDRKSRSQSVRCIGFLECFHYFWPVDFPIFFVLWINEFAHQIHDKGQSFTFNPDGNSKMNKKICKSLNELRAKKFLFNSIKLHMLWQRSSIRMNKNCFENSLFTLKITITPKKCFDSNEALS